MNNQDIIMLAVLSVLCSIIVLDIVLTQYTKIGQKLRDLILFIYSFVSIIGGCYFVDKLIS